MKVLYKIVELTAEYSCRTFILIFFISARYTVIIIKNCILNIILNATMEETVALIKSCIISKKGGVPVKDLNDEFQNLVGEPIPYRRLGFSSLRALLQTVDGLEITSNEGGEKTLKISDSKISHIDRLIQRQKSDYSKTKNKYYKQFTRGFKYKNEFKRNAKMPYDINRVNKKIQNHNFLYDLKLHGIDDDDENHYPVVIETNKVKEIDNVYEPTVNGQQLIGDDFFLQLAIRNLHLPVWRYKDNLALHCGLCISGQTINECTRALMNIDSISNRVVILLGSVDIYNGATSDEMIHDMTELLNVLYFKFHLSNSAITICTIPPLANISIHAYKEKSLTLFCFNNWIRNLTDDTSRQDSLFRGFNRVIDLFKEFSDETYTTEFEWFQTKPRRVSGTKHSYVLWNNKGRKQAMSLICEEKYEYNFLNYLNLL